MYILLISYAHFGSFKRFVSITFIVMNDEFNWLSWVLGFGFLIIYWSVSKVDSPVNGMDAYKLPVKMGWGAWPTGYTL